MTARRGSPASSAAFPAPAGAVGWRAEIAHDPAHGEPAVVVVYCPTLWRTSSAAVTELGPKALVGIVPQALRYLGTQPISTVGGSD